MLIKSKRTSNMELAKNKIFLMSVLLGLHYICRRVIPEIVSQMKKRDEEEKNIEGFEGSLNNYFSSTAGSGLGAKLLDPPSYQEGTYLINLKRRPDRLSLFRRDYAKSDIPNEFKVVDAVDGSKIRLQDQELTELAKAELQQLETTGYRSKHYQLTRGAIGCYMSHIKAWKEILKDNKKVGLIFEDDSKIPVDFQRQLNDKMKNAPPDWDIVLLGVACHTCQGIRTRPGFLRVKKFWLLHSYVISDKAINKIFKSDALFPIAQQIDSLLSELGETLKIYATTPVICEQRASRTDIQAPLKSDGSDPLARLPVGIPGNNFQSITTRITNSLLPTTYAKNGGSASVSKPNDLNKEDEEEFEEEFTVDENPNKKLKII